MESKPGCDQSFCPERNLTDHQSHQSFGTFSWGDLPDEVIGEIFLRLPVKSLLRFKCVSKSMLSLISNPRFIESHLETSLSNSRYIHHSLIYYPNTDRNGFHLKQISLRSALMMNSRTRSEASNVDISSYGWRSMKVYGSSNGLLCIRVHDDFFLWNPSLRKFKKFLPPSFLNAVHYRRLVLYGFGYDNLNDDYKVVGILLSGEKTLVEVYSRRTDSWRSIESIDGYKPAPMRVFIGPSVFADGKLHWTEKELGPMSSNIRKIVSFDSGNEVFGLVEKPNKPKMLSCAWRLGVLGGCLCIIDQQEKCRMTRSSTRADWTPTNFCRADVWVMKEYGVRESWTLVCSVSTYPAYIDMFIPVFWTTNNAVVSNSDFCKSVFLRRTSEILLNFGSTLVVCNLKRKSINYHKIPMGVRRPNVHVYVESLISP